MLSKLEQTGKIKGTLTTFLNQAASICCSLCVNHVERHWLSSWQSTVCRLLFCCYNKKRGVDAFVALYSPRKQERRWQTLLESPWLKAAAPFVTATVAKQLHWSILCNCDSSDDARESTWSIKTDFRTPLMWKVVQFILAHAKLACLHYVVHLQSNTID